MKKAKGSGDYELFLQFLTESRKRKKLSQAELAKRLGRPQSFVSKYESGERRLDIVETLLIGKALGIPERSFLLSFLKLLEGRSK